jgi:endoglucanase
LNPRRRSVVRRLLSSPTAPLLEGHAAATATALATRVGLAVSSDDAGNLLARLDGAGDSPPLVLVAHLDHPAFVIEAAEKGRAALVFRGGVRSGFAAEGTPLTFHTPRSPRATGRGRVISVDDTGGRLRAASAAITSGKAVAGGFAMWDVGEVSVDDVSISGPVCDDLMGVAAAICAMAEVASTKRRPPRSVIGLFTRAEELGFWGALEAIRLGSVPKDTVVLSLECSKALPDAPQGDGVIVRVGDRLSVFDPDVTAALSVAAAAVASGPATTAFRSQRRLMDGGACEASAFCGAGFRASGLALPLANYHNMADAGGRIEREAVLVADFEAEVDLLLELIGGPALAEVGRRRRRPQWLAASGAEARRALSPGPG